MKRRFRKLLALTLALTLLLAMSVSAGAATIAVTGDTGTIPITYTMASSYSVTIPASIVLSGASQQIAITSTVMNIPADKAVNVYLTGGTYAPATGTLTMTRAAGVADTLSATIALNAVTLANATTAVANFVDATTTTNTLATKLTVSAANTAGALAGDYTGNLIFTMQYQ